MGWILTLYAVNLLLIMLVLLREARRPSVGLISIVLVTLVPILGFVVYWLLFSPPAVSCRPVKSSAGGKQSLNASFSSSAHTIAHGIRQHAVSSLRESQVDVLQNGQQTFASITEALRQATTSIDIEYYIYRNDPLGQLIIDILIERARVGVHVRFLRDGVGGRELTRRQVADMRRAGIECKTLFPVKFRLLPTLNYRDHSKIVVVDDQVSFTGGINVGMEYLGLVAETGFWRDTHLRLVGSTARDLKAVFESHWQIATTDIVKLSQHREDGERSVRRERFVSHRWAMELGEDFAPGGPLRELLSSAVRSQQGESSMGKSPEDPEGSLQRAFLHTIEGTPGIGTQKIREAYFIALTSSTKSIDIQTPYFLPDSDLIMALKTAVSRGVRVRLLLPTKLDQKVVLYASRTYYGELVEAGVDIYLYQKGIMHAKVTIVDEETAIVGAANYDARSFRLNYEICEVIYSQDVARKLSSQFAEDLAQSSQLTKAEVEARSTLTRLLDQSARLLSPLL